MNDGSFRFGVGVALAQANESFVGMNPDPEILDGASMNGDSARQVNGFDGRDFHGEKFGMRRGIITALASYSQHYC